MNALQQELLHDWLPSSKNRLLSALLDDLYASEHRMLVNRR